MELGKVLVTSAWPYINVTPHLGNLVGSVLSADVAARYFRLKGEEVVMVSGSDEHGTPIEVEAIKLGVKPKDLTDKNHSRVVELFKKWGISFDNYTRTESPVHKEFVQQHLLKIYRNGYIFPKETQMLYCEKCNRFLPDRFVEGKCPHCGYFPARGDQCDHCGRLLEPTTLMDPHCVICGSQPIIKETRHWYFDLSKFSSKLAEYISQKRQFSSNVKNFSLNLIKEGLKPRAVTRDVGWGIPAPFPGAENKTIYVWVEAVLGYVSATIEYFRNRGDPEGWREYWINKEAKTLYFIGKDNVPFHTIILPALLLASNENYNLPWNVSATEFLQFKGEKASKSQRIGIWIDEALKLFPADYWRYFLIATRPETRDSNFSWEIFAEKINSDLNDTLGNFIHRTLSFINAQFKSEVPEPTAIDEEDRQVLDALKKRVEEVAQNYEALRLQFAANGVIGLARSGNQYLNEKEPWKLIKRDRAKAGTIMYVAVQMVKALSIISSPIIPFTAEELWKTLKLPGSLHTQKWSEALKPLSPGHKIDRAKPLFQKVASNEKELDEMLEKVRENAEKPVKRSTD